MNPFKFGTIVEGDFFTDRVEETAVLLQKLDSENHIVLISPRRFGKSSLVQKVLFSSVRAVLGRAAWCRKCSRKWTGLR